MSKSEIDAESLLELLGKISPDLRQAFKKLIKMSAIAQSTTTIETIKGWIEQYEEDHIVDRIIGMFILKIIGEAGIDIMSDINEHKKSGSHYSGKRGVQVGIKSLKKIVNYLEDKLESDE